MPLRVLRISLRDRDISWFLDHWFYKDGSVITYFEIVNSFGEPTTQEKMDGWIGEVHKPMVAPLAGRIY